MEKKIEKNELDIVVTVNVNGDEWKKGTEKAGGAAGSLRAEQADRFHADYRQEADETERCRASPNGCRSDTQASPRFQAPCGEG